MYFSLTKVICNELLSSPILGFDLIFLISINVEKSLIWKHFEFGISIINTFLPIFRLICD